TDQFQVENKKPSLNYYDYILKSGFQPIFSISHRRAVGYEALLRPFKNLQIVSPEEVFMNAVYAGVSADLDIICHTLHAYNFKETIKDNDNWLFLNIIPSSIVYYDVGVMNFEEVLKRTGIQANQIVIEILENDIANDPRIDDAIEYFKEIGCKIAIDDFGAGYSNFERIWRLEPDMVKLDRTIIKRTAYSERLNFSLSKLVALLHETGSLVLAEGIETEEEGLLAIDSDVDLVQGYYFSKPFLADQFSELNDDKCEYLHNVFRKKTLEEANSSNETLMPYVRYLDNFVYSLKAGVTIDNAIDTNKDVLTSWGLSDLRRIYMIDENGYQIGSNIDIQVPNSNGSKKLSPLVNTSNSNWYYRPYFRSAISLPNAIHCSGPYLSMTDAEMCLTLSVAVMINGKLMVICCDIDWSNSSSSNAGINFTPKALLN
ncbi:MAG: EAL domain-containing protein, partial [Gammaproteobacteria bacterium]